MALDSLQSTVVADLATPIVQNVQETSIVAPSVSQDILLMCLVKDV